MTIKGEDGEWVHNKERVKGIIVAYFSNLFMDDGVDGLYNVPIDVFPELPNRDWQTLSRPFTRLEIEDVVKSLKSLKAPGPDGFQALFYQKNWELVKENVF